MDITRLWACIDCRDLAAGFSEHELGREYPAAVLAAPARIAADNGVPVSSVELIAAPPDDIDGNDVDDNGESAITIDFSWHRCEVCLSALGGSRHAIDLTIGA